MVNDPTPKHKIFVAARRSVLQPEYNGPNLLNIHWNLEHFLHLSKFIQIYEKRKTKLLHGHEFLRLFAKTLEVKLCGPTVRLELFGWSPPVVNLIDWTSFRKTQSPRLHLVP